MPSELTIIEQKKNRKVPICIFTLNNARLASPILSSG